MATTTTDEQTVLRNPTKEDGAAIWSLIRRCKPLDENSMYCNLLQCDHFSDTCIVAETAGEIRAWVSGYVPPSEPDSLFIWQVAVDASARGEGLGKKVISALMNEVSDNDDFGDIRRLKTTITRSNEASWGLFESFADDTGAELSSEAYFKEEDHFDGAAPTEHMVTITFKEALRLAS